MSKRLSSSDISEDKIEIATLLFHEIEPVSSQGKVYGWTFTSGKKSVAQGKATEINFVLLGTGTMPNFSAHQVISEGGDVLCHISLEKGNFAEQPTILITGVGTVALKPDETSISNETSEENSEKNNEKIDDNTSQETSAYYPINALLDPHIKYFGDTSELVFGGGIQQRLIIAMEQFFIPNLIHLILNNKISHEDKVIFDINIIGHSRGAITGFYLMTCIDEWLKTVRENPESINIEQLSKLCNVEITFVIQAIYLLQNFNVDCCINSLSFDPVEGKCRVSEVSAWLSHDTTLFVPLTCMQNPLTSNCSNMPARVNRAEIFLAESERRLDFRPTIPTFCDSTKVTYKVQIGTGS